MQVDDHHHTGVHRDTVQGYVADQTPHTGMSLGPWVGNGRPVPVTNEITAARGKVSPFRLASPEIRRCGPQRGGNWTVAPPL